MAEHAETVIDRVRRSLGRTGPAATLPVPPPLPDALVRLVRGDEDLAAVFERKASALKMLVQRVTEGELIGQMAAFLRERNSRSVMLSDTPVLRRLDVEGRLPREGFVVKSWRDMTLDETYEFDAGVTEVDYAVAETGTLAIRHRPEHGRLLSLVPFVHVAVVERATFVADLLDFFELLKAEGAVGSGVTMISGPSKTADIEMNVVTGVHGPNVVKAFVLE